MARRKMFLDHVLKVILFKTICKLSIRQQKVFFVCVFFRKSFDHADNLQALDMCDKMGFIRFQIDLLQPQRTMSAKNIHIEHFESWVLELEMLWENIAQISTEMKCLSTG